MEQVILAVCTLVSDLRSDREVVSARKTLEVVGNLLKLPTIPHMLPLDLRPLVPFPERSRNKDKVYVNMRTEVCTLYDKWDVRNIPSVAQELESDSYFHVTHVEMTHTCADLNSRFQPSEPFPGNDSWMYGTHVPTQYVDGEASLGMCLRNYAKVKWITVTGCEIFEIADLYGKCKGLRFTEYEAEVYSSFKESDFDSELPSWRGHTIFPSSRQTKPSEVRTLIEHFER